MFPFPFDSEYTLIYHLLSLDELAYRAKKNNVDIFALTDHDSVFGTFEVFVVLFELTVNVS